MHSEQTKKVCNVCCFLYQMRSLMGAKLGAYVDNGLAVSSAIHFPTPPMKLKPKAGSSEPCTTLEISETE